MTGSHEVRGSIPLGSTHLLKSEFVTVNDLTTQSQETEADGFTNINPRSADSKMIQARIE